MQSARTDKNTPKVSVVIVTWNRKDDVLETLATVYGQVYKHFEVVLVDNASEDDTVAVVSQRYPGINIVQLEENRGAAGGRNPGIRAARGDIVFLLDSDASIQSDTLLVIVDYLERHPDISGVTCKVLIEATGEIDRASWLFSEIDMADSDKEFVSYAFCEGASAFRREVFDSIDLFWEFLFYGREGEELAVRAFGAGHPIIYLPSAVVFHRVSPDRRIDVEHQLYYDLRNALAIYLRNYPLWFLAFVAPLKVTTSIVKGIKYRKLHSIWRAIKDVVTNLSVILRQRRAIGHRAAWRYFQHQRAHGPFRWNIVSWLKYNKYKKQTNST